MFTDLIADTRKLKLLHALTHIELQYIKYICKSEKSKWMLVDVLRASEVCREKQRVPVTFSVNCASYIAILL
jgi:hypothetical protein